MNKKAFAIAVAYVAVGVIASTAILTTLQLMWGSGGLKTALRMGIAVGIGNALGVSSRKLYWQLEERYNK
jgi:hypothetical protein